MPNKEQPKPLNEYSRWSSLSFQMIGSILALVFTGRFIDKYFKLSHPYFTIIGSVSGTIVAFYLLFKEAGKK